MVEHRVSRRALKAGPVLLTLALLLPATVVSASNISFGSGDGEVSVRHMAPMKNPSGAFSDKYTVEARFRAGGEYYFSIHHSSFGIGEPTFEVVSRYRAPDGEEYRTRQTLGRGRFSVEEGATLDLRMGRHRLSGTPERWTIVAESDEISTELTFRPLVPPWRPGSGRAHFGSGYLDQTILAGRAAVKGTIRLNDETTLEVTGTGYALHSHSDMALHDLARRMLGFRSERGPLVFYFREIEPVARLNSEPVRWLYVARQGEIVFQSTDFSLTHGDFKTDMEHGNRYRVPRSVRIEAREGERVFTAVMRTTKKRWRTDRLEELSSVERAVASRFAKPVVYSYEAAFEARLTSEGEEESFRGRGVYEVDHVNK